MVNGCLLAVACYSTNENGRAKYSKRTFDSLLETVDFNKHELWISDNGSSSEMQEFYEDFKSRFRKLFPALNLTILKNGCNLGTSNAISLAWRHRKPLQHCMKMDDDCIVHQSGWLDIMEEVLNVQPKIGIVGLKRKDLQESTKNENAHYKTTLHQLDHVKGERWLIVEQAEHIFGTCQLYNHLFLDVVGYLAQPTAYGFDDSLMATRSRLAGFYGVFVPSIEISHIDEGGNDYTNYKAKHAGEVMPIYNQWKTEYESGARSIYYEPNWIDLEKQIETANNK